MNILEQKLSALVNQMTVLMGCLELGQTEKALQVGRSAVINLRSLALAITALSDV